MLAWSILSGLSAHLSNWLTFISYRDWKKLTFYYFADSYINFNSLVTDLFKIYKTRIWMSAINPASFVTPPGAGLQPSGSLGYGQEAGPSDRRHHDRAFGGSRESVETGRDYVTNPMLRNAYADSNYPAFAQAPRHAAEPGPSGFSGLPGQPDPFAAYAPPPPPPGAYGSMETGYTDYANSPRIPPVPSDWVNRFQGLSLGS